MLVCQMLWGGGLISICLYETFKNNVPEAMPVTSSGTTLILSLESCHSHIPSWRMGITHHARVKRIIRLHIEQHYQEYSLSQLLHLKRHVKKEEGNLSACVFCLFVWTVCKPLFSKSSRTVLKTREKAKIQDNKSKQLGISRNITSYIWLTNNSTSYIVTF